MSDSKWKKVATMKLENGIVVVDLEPNVIWADEVVYAWKTAVNGRWVRIGTRKSKLGIRLKQYATHINQSLLEGKEKPTPIDEARKWIIRLKKYRKLIAAVYQPPEIDSIVVGKIRPYLDIERALIQKYKIKYGNYEPLLNRSHR